METPYWLPVDLLSTVIALAIQKKNREFDSIGTGVLLQVDGINCLVTARHIIDDVKNKPLWVVSRDKLGNPIFRNLAEFQKENDFEWVCSDKADVAISVIPASPQEAALFMGPEVLGNFDDIGLGAEVFFLGYPNSIPTLENSWPIIRQGIVAYRDGQQKQFLIDANVFPGNSGGPVFLKNVLAHRQGSTIIIGAESKASLIGIATEFLTHSNPLFDEQAEERARLPENAHLGVVESANRINELIQGTKFQELLEKAKVFSKKKKDEAQSTSNSIKG